MITTVNFSVKFAISTLELKINWGIINNRNCIKKKIKNLIDDVAIGEEKEILEEQYLKNNQEATKKEEEKN